MNASQSTHAQSQVPSSVRTGAWISLSIALLHLIFGAIVRISGSGMGCGDHWPKCYGRWFPPLDRLDLIVEVSHRYLASILSFAILILAFNAWRYRQRIGVGGRGGVWRAAFVALVLVLAAATFGADHRNNQRTNERHGNEQMHNRRPPRVGRLDGDRAKRRSR
ncbi:MAG: COX15/CtaA family protein, partial [Gemmatimonas sp.]